MIMRINMKFQTVWIITLVILISTIFSISVLGTRFTNETWEAINRTPTQLGGLGQISGEFNDKLYFFGGAERHSVSPVSATIQEYNPQLDTWRLFPSGYPNPLTYEGGVLYDGCFYLLGGRTGSSYDNIIPVTDFWILNMTTEQWTKGPNYAVPIMDSILVGFKNRIYSFGGYTATNPDEYTRLSSVKYYDITNQTWVSLSSGPTDKLTYESGARGVNIENSIFILDGDATLRKYSPDTDDTWTTLTTISDYGRDMTSLDNLLVINQAFFSPALIDTSNIIVFDVNNNIAESISINNSATDNYYHLTSIKQRLYQYDTPNVFQEIIHSKIQTAPNAPLNLQASAGDEEIILSWSPPTTDGGSPITNYKIYRGNTSSGETLLTTVGNITTYSDTGLTNNQAYYYKVSAVNGVGEGVQSNEASATPTTGGEPPPDDGNGDGGDKTPGFELTTIFIATTLAFALVTFSRKRKK